jgi:Protein of unknown function (DUF455)
MSSHKHLCSLYYLLKFIMRKLRYELLTEPNIFNKISLCELIYDCAASIEEIYRLNISVNDEYFIPEVELLSLSSMSEIVQSSLTEKIERTLCFLKIIDFQAIHLRAEHPKVCNIVRRNVENISSFYLRSSFVSIPQNTEALIIPQYISTMGLGDLSWPNIPSKPARDIAISMRQEKDDDASILARLHKQIYGIEIPAAEVCAVIPLIVPDLPLELDLNLAQQTYDEGRHARLLLNFFLLNGGIIEDYQNSFRIWDNVLNGTTLIELLCIEHVLGEGYALGYDLKAIHDYQNDGMTELASIHWELHEDEVMHVSTGLFWFNRLAQESADEIISRFEESYAVIPPPDPFFSEEIRRLVGFSSEQIQRQRNFTLKH